MTGRVVIDFETRSLADLGVVGVWNYSLHPSTELICACYRIIDDPAAADPALFKAMNVLQWRQKDTAARRAQIAALEKRRADGEKNLTKQVTALSEFEYPPAPEFEIVKAWRMGDPPPADLMHAIMSGYSVEAHNYSFELAIWTNVARARLGWRSVMPPQWRDTMAAACYMAMPAALDQLSRALGLPGKDPKGGRLISRYSKLYLPTARADLPPEDLENFVDYCRQDVILEQVAGDYLGELPPAELDAFQLDQEINLRGLYLDAEGIAAATDIVEQRKAELVDKFQTLTDLKPTQTAKVKEWAAAHGVVLENMQADYLDDLVEEGDLPQGPVRDALVIRLQINKSSTDKLRRMAAERAPDGRARWQCRYHGAQTGRWTGGGFQPLNMVRSWEAEKGDEEGSVNRLVRDVMYRSPPWLDACYGDAMEAVSKAGRHWIMAAPGHRIMSGDFVSIEAVILACVAGEDWKVEAFRSGVKIYELMGDKIYGLPPGTVKKATHPAQRQDGKTGELAFGYQGGLGAWLKFDDSGRHSDARIHEIKDAWREEHPMIVKMWDGLGRAAIDAVNAPGEVTNYRDIGFKVYDDFLAMILPNGKHIWYRDPEVKSTMPRWHTPEVEFIKGDASCELIPNPCFKLNSTCTCKPRPTLSYSAQKTGQWKRVSTYGGKLAENCMQATSREFLVPSIKAVRKAKYPVILTVYDEIVCEVPAGHGSLEEFTGLLKDAPGFPRDWAKGWPIGVDAWEGQRYRK